MTRKFKLTVVYYLLRFAIWIINKSSYIEYDLYDYENIERLIKLKERIETSL